MLPATPVFGAFVPCPHLNVVRSRLLCLARRRILCLKSCPPQDGRPGIIVWTEGSATNVLGLYTEQDSVEKSHWVCYCRIVHPLAREGSARISCCRGLQVLRDIAATSLIQQKVPRVSPVSSFDSVCVACGAV